LHPIGPSNLPGDRRCRNAASRAIEIDPDYYAAHCEGHGAGGATSRGANAGRWIGTTGDTEKRRFAVDDAISIFPVRIPNGQALAPALAIVG